MEYNSGFKGLISADRYVAVTLIVFQSEMR